MSGYIVETGSARIDLETGTDKVYAGRTYLLYLFYLSVYLLHGIYIMGMYKYITHSVTLYLLDTIYNGVNHTDIQYVVYGNSIRNRSISFYTDLY